MSIQTTEEACNEQAIRALYALAEGNAKDTSEFVVGFTDDGYLYELSAGKKYFGRDIGVTVDVYPYANAKRHVKIQRAAKPGRQRRNQRGR